MLSLIVDYYNATYEIYNFRKPADDICQDLITIRVKMDKYGRCHIGSEVFSSAISLRHKKSSYVLTKFITNNGGTDCYPEQVQYFFTHIVDFPGSPSVHFLAYIRWYLHADSAKTRYHFSINDDGEEICNVELWKIDFYSESQDCVILIHNILSRF